VQWTPTLLVMTPDGVEAHRIDGFLQVDDLIAQLTLGLGKVWFKEEKFPEAERHFRDVVERFGSTEAAPEAAYWAGVSAYKATNDAGKLKETYKALQQKYPSSEWARKAVVWAG
jgi:outer membrane protein assembly factor BamD (BamD/ComL family)